MYLKDIDPDSEDNALIASMSDEEDGKVYKVVLNSLLVCVKVKVRQNWEIHDSLSKNPLQIQKSRRK